MKPMHEIMLELIQLKHQIVKSVKHWGLSDLNSPIIQ